MSKIPAERVALWLKQLEDGLLRRYDNGEQDHELQEVAMIGIMTGGVTVAQRLHQRLNVRLPLGQLNISFYRDDFSHIGLHPVVGASELPFTVEDRHIILVDDVLNTGRTIRAALNEIFDYGRPASVALAVLVEREGRELPIRPDVTGHKIALSADQQIKLNPDTMECVLREPDNPATRSQDT